MGIAGGIKLEISANFAVFLVVCLTSILGLLVWIMAPAKEAPEFVPKGEALDINVCRKKLRNAISTLCPKTGKRYLVIGGGFLGSRIVEMLLLRGENDVTVMEFSMGSRWCTDPRVSFICGDISLLEDSVVACRGREAVFLTAAAPAFTDKIQYQYEKSFRVNAVGCDNIIKACIVCDVNFLILSSTLLVTARCGLGSAVTVSETDPFVDHDSCMCYYASGKALAEQLVHRAHGMVHENHMTELNTIALRIPAAFGAKDDCIVQQMLRSNECMYLGFDSLRHWSYIDNVAFAHLLGEAKLCSEAVAVGGKSFIVHGEEPIRSDYFRSMVAHYGQLTVRQGPWRLVRAAALFVDIMQRILHHRFPQLTPPLSWLTSTAVQLMDTDVTTKSDAVQRLLGYTPLFSVEEGIQLAILEQRDPILNSIFLSDART